MNVQTCRGFAPIWLVVVLAGSVLGVGVVAVKKGAGVFSGGDTKAAQAQAVILAEANMRAKQAADEARQARADADAARANLQTLEMKRHEAVTEDIAGAVMALEKEPEPSLCVQAGLALARSAYRNSDAITDNRLDEMRQFVARLTAENAQIRVSAAKQLVERQNAWDHERDVLETAYRSEVKAKEAEKISAETLAATTAGQRDAQIVKTKEAIDQVKTLGQRLASATRWALGCVVLFVLLLWVLPVIARACPGVSWLTRAAKWGGGILAGGLHLLHEGETRVISSGLAETGRAVAAIRRTLPEVAGDVTKILDQHLSDPNKAIVASAATAAGNPPTT